jgi:murein DD-endopeptidase MepM/ murein hydrolase activator NlpD
VKPEQSLSPTQKTLRTFAAGAGCGFLAGAFLVAAVVWQHGNVIGSRAASREHPAQAPSAIERWKEGINSGVDDAGQGIIEAGKAEIAVATSGRETPVIRPAASPELVLTAPPAAELADRDLLVPVEGVQPDQLVRSFSDARGGRHHEALDILAPRNTPVKAVESGKIARLFYSKAGGITVYQFDPTEQYCYYYAHLERYADGLAEGQPVQKGQVLGYVGVSGNAPKDAPHLHFAVFRLTAAKRWWEGTAIDPYDVLR